jgi:hypothetical protein
MTYVVNVPLEVSTPISESDPDVRSIRRLPGFLRFQNVGGHRRRYELSFEVEGGSLRDAMDAADELVLEYENALDAYGPKRLAEVAPQAR